MPFSARKTPNTFIVQFIEEHLGKMEKLKEKKPDLLSVGGLLILKCLDRRHHLFLLAFWKDSPKKTNSQLYTK